jgi:nicotinamide-nucleotide adenylyltransferase
MIEGANHNETNVAVAIIDEPTFVGKSRVLLSYLQHRLSRLDTHFPDSLPSPLPKIRLTFLQGFDTLERLFSARYYSSEADMSSSIRHFLSPSGDDSAIVCAHRKSIVSEGRERTMAAAREFILSGHLTFISIGEEEQTYSSSEVRATRSQGDERWKKQVTDKIKEYIIKHSLYLNST